MLMQFMMEIHERIQFFYLCLYLISRRRGTRIDTLSKFDYRLGSGGN